MRPTLDEYYLAMLALVASRGTCPRRQVAAILVDSHGQLISTGYNGNAAGRAHCIEVPCAGATSEDRSKCEAIHAEANAILQAAGNQRAPHTLYCSTTPCFNCANLLASIGIKKVIAATLYKYDTKGCRLLERAGCKVLVMRAGTYIDWKEVKHDEY